MLWALFTSFLLIGLVSFGGGYAMIPVIERQAAAHHWAHDPQQLTDIVAVAGMAPGPIATNTAVMIGYQQAGWLGALVAVVGAILPSCVILLLLLMFLRRLSRYRWTRSAFYGIRPVVTALIAFAAIRFAETNRPAAFADLHAIGLALIFIASLFALIRYRIAPVYVILGAGIAGILMN